MSDHWRIFAM
jgi:hypothetical protein